MVSFILNHADHVLELMLEEPPFPTVVSFLKLYTLRLQFMQNCMVVREFPELHPHIVDQSQKITNSE